MTQIHYGQRPPNYEAILAVFPGASGPGVVFAYGYSIYVTGRIPLQPAILAHELVHCERQIRMGVENWWSNYLVDKSFRYDEELLAHRAEYQALVENVPTRQQRRRILADIAKKLSAPLYGRMVTFEQAKKDLA